MEENQRRRISKLLVILGKTSSGKDVTLNNLVAKHGYKKIITYTTRPMRLNEQQDVTYHFISEDDFVQRITKLDKVVFYTISQDTRALVDCLPKEILGKIEYCDIAAIKNSKLEYKSKKVYPPSALNKKLKDYTIYVSSLMYADEIYNDLVESEVDITRS